MAWLRNIMLMIINIKICIREITITMKLTRLIEINKSLVKSHIKTLLTIIVLHVINNIITKVSVIINNKTTNHQVSAITIKIDNHHRFLVVLDSDRF